RTDRRDPSSRAPSATRSRARSVPAGIPSSASRARWRSSAMRSAISRAGPILLAPSKTGLLACRSVCEMTRDRYAVGLLPGLMFFLTTAAHAQGPAPVTVPAPGGDVTVVADRMEQIGADNLIIATGNVELTRGASRL